VKGSICVSLFWSNFGIVQAVDCLFTSLVDRINSHPENKETSPSVFVQATAQDIGQTEITKTLQLMKESQKQYEFQRILDVFFHGLSAGFPRP